MAEHRSLEGIPHSSCLLIRLKGRAEPQRTERELRMKADGVRPFWDRERWGGKKKKGGGRGYDWRGRCWEKVETERREDGRERRSSVVQFTNVSPLQCTIFDKVESRSFFAVSPFSK